jgi:hypothetical protein
MALDRHFDRSVFQPGRLIADVQALSCDCLLLSHSSRSRLSAQPTISGHKQPLGFIEVMAEVYAADAHGF